MIFFILLIITQKKKSNYQQNRPLGANPHKKDSRHAGGHGVHMKTGQAKKHIGRDAETSSAFLFSIFSPAW
ncbi:MAG: hypothetical protein II921_07820 [Treponema sp.]|nr:hypothetical protein [Treponema sp.]